MFSPNFKEEAVDGLIEHFTSEGLMSPLRPTASPEEKKTVGHGIQTCLKMYFDTVEKGYLQTLEEVKKRWGESRVKEFSLPITSLERVKDPAELAKITEEFPTLQAYFNYSNEMVREVFVLATSLAEERAWNEAVSILVFLLYLNPMIGECWQTLGECWEEANNLEAAQFAYEYAIQCNPTDPEFYRSACQCLIEQRNYDRAKEVLQEGLSTLDEQPNSPEKAEAIELLSAALVYVGSLK